MLNRFFIFSLLTINSLSSKLNLALFSFSINMEDEDSGSPASVSLIQIRYQFSENTVLNSVLHVFQD